MKIITTLSVLTIILMSANVFANMPQQTTGSMLNGTFKMPGKNTNNQQANKIGTHFSSSNSVGQTNSGQQNNTYIHTGLQTGNVSGSITNMGNTVGPNANTQ